MRKLRELTNATDALEDGEDPVKKRWEDGIGHAVSWEYSNHPWEYTIQGHEQLSDDPEDTCWDTIKTKDVNEAADHIRRTHTPIAIYIDDELIGTCVTKRAKHSPSYGWCAP